MNYISHTEKQKQKMLQEIGIDNISALFKDIPENISLKKNLKLDKLESEYQLVEHFKNISSSNSNDVVSFCGGGCYDHFIPTAVDHIANRSEFSTAYTPYQPEVSQGTLQAIYEYQSFICLLTGMDITNASMYDGASAVSEAVLMAHRINSKSKILVSKTLHPDYISTLDTYLNPLGLKTEYISPKGYLTDIEKMSDKIDKDTFAVVLQVPNFFGYIEDIDKIREIIHKNDALFIVNVDPMSLGLIVPPSEYDADIVVGDGQSLGNYQSFGGPTFGFLATREKWIRNLPGRLVGKTVDKKGKDAFTLTLQTREQHIRRHRATSNICSNQSLNALRAAVFCSLMGRGGLKKVARLCFSKSHYLAEQIDKLDKFKVYLENPFFKEFVVKSEIDINDINKVLFKEGIIGGINLRNYDFDKEQCMLISVTEKRTKQEMDRLVDILDKM